MIQELIRRLSALDPQPTAEELADALWLLERFRSTGSVERQADQADTDELPELPPPQESSRPDTGDTASDLLAGGESGLQVGMFVAEPSTAGLPAALVHSPSGPAIPSSLRLARALRPLRVTAPSPTDRLLDENETAHRFAETGVLDPVTMPSPERCFDLALVIDSSPSMSLWQRTGAELESALIHLGAFRAVRLWRVNSDGDRLLFHAGAGPPRSPDELTDPTQRRLVLVMSDCIGAAWRDGRFSTQLERWGKAGPVAIIQPLPQRLWWRCGVGFERVTVQATLGGIPNDRLVVRSREVGMAAPESSDGIAVPVLELEPRWLLPWASAVAVGGQNIEGMALFTGRTTREVGTEAEVVPSSAMERVMRFRATASPTAYRLAGYLAAAPLRLPVMRLVQTAMLRESMPSYLAEVFLGDLLRRVDPGAQTPSEETEYEFHDGVREVLLSSLRRGEALQVLRTVWYVVRDRLGSSESFPAMLRAVDENRSDFRPDQQFAQVACHVLAHLGGRYGDIAQRLNAQLAGSQAPSGGLRNPAGTGAIWDPSLPARNRDFVGRDELVSAIRSGLEAGVTVLLPHDSQAPVGEGKSQLAVEYAHRFAAEYDLVWWVPAEQSTSTLAALDALAVRLGTPLGDDRKEMLDNVFRALGEGHPSHRWLLIFDDARDPEELIPFIPARGKPLSPLLPTGNVLITSRDHRWNRHAETVKVDVFQRHESIASLRHFDLRLSVEQADELAGLVHDLPLAVAHVGAWLTMTGQGVAEYRQAFTERVGQLGAHELPENFPPELAASVSISLDRLRAENREASDLLELWVCFGSEPVAWDLLSDGADWEALSDGDEAEHPLRRLLKDEETSLAAMADIERFRLGRFDREARSLQVHRLVRELLGSRIGPDRHRVIRGQVQRMLAAATPRTRPADERTWRRRAQIMPHVGPAEVVDGDTDKIRAVALDQARYLYSRADFAGSRLLAESAYEKWCERFGDDAESVLDAERVLANALRALGEMARAAEVNGNLLERMLRRFGPDNPATLLTANGYGADLRFLGDFVRASELDRDTWDRMQRARKVEVNDALLAANNVAIDYRLLGEFEKALAVDREAVQILEHTSPTSQRDHFRITHNFGRDLRGLGRYDEAVRTLNDGLSLVVPVLGHDHAIVLQAQMSLADVLRKAGDAPGAEELAAVVLQAHLRRFGADHPNTLAAKRCLALAHVENGNPERGRVLSQEALDGYRRVMGTGHPFAHACASGLAIALRALGDPETALVVDLEATEGLRHGRLGGGSGHYYALCAAVGLASDHYLVGDLDTAREIITDARTRLRALLGRDHPYTLAADHNLRLAVGVERGRPLECDIEPTPL